MIARRKILIADDEPAIRAGYKALFESEGFAVSTAKDGAEAVVRFRERCPEVVLLDVMMPRKNGIAACAEIRAEDPLVPIIFFTAMPSEASVVRGLGFGADDYIAKDRSPDEFVARVRSALRRADAVKAAVREGEKIYIGGAVADLVRLTVSGAGRTETLTKNEGAALRLLAGDRGRHFSHSEIFSAIYGEGYNGDEGAIRVVISRLKRKLGSASGFICSTRGLGYRLLK